MLAAIALCLLPMGVSAQEARVWLTPDFFIETTAAARAGGAARRLDDGSDCRAAIAAKVCLVGPRSGPGERSCEPGGDAYADRFVALYDSYPPALRKIFCFVDKVFVEREFFGSAYGGLIQDRDGNVLGGLVGIRQSILDERLSLSRWASWKEQLPFGGHRTDYRIREDLPRVDAGGGGADDALFFLFAHEFGHILDFSRGLNRRGWGEIGWIDWNQSRHDGVFPLRRRLDFYGDGPRLDSGEVAPAYSQLELTDFISLYAAMNPFDDFAETVAFLALSSAGGRYVIRTGAPGADRSLDALSRLASPALRAKRGYLESVLSERRPPKAPLPRSGVLTSLLAAPSRWN